MTDLYCRRLYTEPRPAPRRTVAATLQHRRCHPTAPSLPPYSTVAALDTWVRQYTCALHCRSTGQCGSVCFRHFGGVSNGSLHVQLEYSMAGSQRVPIQSEYSMTGGPCVAMRGPRPECGATPGAAPAVRPPAPRAAFGCLATLFPPAAPAAAPAPPVSEARPTGLAAGIPGGCEGDVGGQQPGMLSAPPLPLPPPPVLHAHAPGCLAAVRADGASHPCVALKGTGMLLGVGTPRDVGAPRLRPARRSHACIHGRMQLYGRMGEKVHAVAGARRRMGHMQSHGRMGAPACVGTWAHGHMGARAHAVAWAHRAHAVAWAHGRTWLRRRMGTWAQGRVRMCGRIGRMGACSRMGMPGRLV
eukprot:365618-Chlamydomonas_euryale.AAC.6